MPPINTTRGTIPAPIGYAQQTATEIAGATGAVPVNTIPSLLTELDDALANLGKSLDELETRIRPVLTPEAPAPANVQCPQPARGQSQIADSIESQTERIRRFRRGVEELISRVEV